MNEPPKILYLVTEDWYFCSHRLPHAIAARQAGYAVTVVTRVRHHGEQISAAGLGLIPLDWSRREANPLRMLRDLWRIYRILRTERPDLLHNVALKPVLYGSLAAGLAGITPVVNALAGLGSLYTSGRVGIRSLRTLLRPLLRKLLSRSGSRVIVQNPDDLATLVDLAIIPVHQAVLIRGAGVDTDSLQPIPEPVTPPVVVLAARMLWSKGVGEFVEAARLLRQQGCMARFVLVGDIDPDNGDSIDHARLMTWHSSGVIEWWGYRDDVPEIFSNSHIVCLPSCYGEGIPRVLLEAAALARPIITTDWPGCREVVRHDWNGLLIPPRNAPALAAAIQGLLKEPERRRRMGRNGRQRAIEAFTLTRVAQEILAVYRALLTQN